MLTAFIVLQRKESEKACRCWQVGLRFHGFLFKSMRATCEHICSEDEDCWRACDAASSPSAIDSSSAPICEI